MKNSLDKKTNFLNRRELITLIGTTGVFGLTSFSERDKDAIKTINKRILLNTDEINNNNYPMKTIGILGGLGPQATMNFEEHIHCASQRLIPQLQNRGYPPMIVYYYRQAPILLNKDFSPVLPIQPDPRLLETAKRLGAMADFLLIPSNGVHIVQKEIEHASGRKVLSIIDVTLEEVKNRKWRKVGVLGYKTPEVYTNRLKDMNIAFEVIDDELQAKLDVSIMRVMEGRDNIEDRKNVKGIIKVLRSKKVDGIIPGCTEIPLLLNEIVNDADLINPAQILAEAAVSHSLS